MSYDDVFGDPQPKQVKTECPYCHKLNTHHIYRPEVYEFDSFCRDCDRGFNKDFLVIKPVSSEIKS